MKKELIEKLISFIEDVQTNCCAGEEEKESLLANLKITFNQGTKLPPVEQIERDSEHEIKAETLEKIIEKQEEYIAFLIDLIEIDIKIADVSFEERVKRESEIQALKTTYRCIVNCGEFQGKEPEKIQTASEMLKEGLDDARYANIVDDINIDINTPFFNAIIQFAEDYHNQFGK